MQKKLVILAIFGLFIFGAARPAYAAGNIFQNLGNRFLGFIHQIYFALPGDKPGKDVVLLSMQKMQDLHTVQLTTTASLDLQAQQHSLAKFQLTANGPVQIQNFFDPRTYTQAQSLDIHASMQGSDIHFSADTRTTSDAFFIKLNEVPVLPFLSLDTVTSKWLKLSMSNPNIKTDLTPDQMQKLHDAVWQLINVAQFSPAKKEKHDDHDVFVVNVTIPQAALTTYLTTVSGIMPPTTQYGEQQAATASLMNQVISKIGDLHITMWVDRGSFYLRHVELPMTYPLDKSSVPPMTSANDPLALFKDADAISATIAVSLDHVNEPVQIDIPQDAQDFQTVFQKALPSPQVPTNMNAMPTELPQLSPAQRSLLQKYQLNQNAQ